MTEILEAVGAFFAIFIYGSEENPKHPIWRTALRAAFLVGYAVSVATLFGLIDVAFPLWLTILWIACWGVILMAEFEVGSKAMGVLAALLLPLWLAILGFTNLS